MCLRQIIVWGEGPMSAKYLSVKDMEITIEKCDCIANNKLGKINNLKGEISNHQFHKEMVCK